MSEKCQRCGEDGEDRRTLWMACFYKMSELGLPFQEEVVGAGDTGQRFYTLRVCKTCRADWMRAIENWFKERPAPDDGVPGYYIRDKGAARLMTPEEIERIRREKL